MIGLLPLLPLIIVFVGISFFMHLTKPKNRNQNIYYSEPHDIYHRLEPFAKNTKIILQMLIGLGLTYFILLKLLVLTGAVVTKDNILLKSIQNAQPLQIVGIALAYSSAIELAYTLYTPGPDEAVDPLITGLAAAILLGISDPKSFTIQDAIAVVLFLIVLASLFTIRKVFILTESSNSSDKEHHSETITTSTQNIQVRQTYLKLVERKGTAEQIAAAIYTTSAWLIVNPQDVEVRLIYLELVGRQGTTDQVATAVYTTNIWLAAKPQNAQVRRAFIELLGKTGTQVQITNLIDTTARWLNDNPQDVEVRQAYLELVEQKGTAEQIATAIEDAAQWEASITKFEDHTIIQRAKNLLNKLKKK